MPHSARWVTQRALCRPEDEACSVCGYEGGTTLTGAAVLATPAASAVVGVALATLSVVVLGLGLGRGSVSQCFADALKPNVASRRLHGVLTAGQLGIFPTAESPGVVRTELRAPRWGRLVRDDDPALRQEVFDISEARAEPIVELDNVAAAAGTAVALVRGTVLSS